MLEVVNRAVAHQVFHALVEQPLVSKGFKIRKDGNFVRQVSVDVFHLVGIRAVKGGRYGLIWGAGFPFFPARWNPRVEWKRTLAQIPFHLFQSPFVDPATHTLGISPLADGLSGADAFAASFAGVWERYGARAIANWFADARTLEGLICIAQAQAYGTVPGVSLHAPRPGIVAAFLLKRCGRGEEAQTEFERFVSTFGRFEPQGGVDRLFYALQVVNAG